MCLSTKKLCRKIEKNVLKLFCAQENHCKKSHLYFTNPCICVLNKVHDYFELPQSGLISDFTLQRT